MTTDYESFVAQKLTRVPATGLASVPELHPSLFPHQRDLVSWSLRRGRAASPFMGIGSEGYVALQMGRKFIGAELKKSYYEMAVKNLREAAETKQHDLFAMS